MAKTVRLCVHTGPSLDRNPIKQLWFILIQSFFSSAQVRGARGHWSRFSYSRSGTQAHQLEVSDLNAQGCHGHIEKK